MVQSSKAGEKLLLEIFYNSVPAFSVPEYAEVELRLTNQSGETLEGVAVRVGGDKIRADLKLRPGASWSIPFKVDDLVGELRFSASDPTSENEATAALEVVPQKLSLSEVFYIKTERLPALLARLDAPNGFQLRYQDRADEPPKLFDFFSADYTAEKLRYFSQAFLQGGTGEAILNRLDYLTLEQRSNDLTIRGPVRWPVTIQNWLNRPAETGLRHEWTQSPKNFATLPNLLFVRFQLELARELVRLVRFVELGGPASPRLQKALPELRERAYNHRALTESPLLPSPDLALEWDRHDSSALSAMTVECERAAAFNPAYTRLSALWGDFTSRYVSLPEDETALARSGLQPMSKIYELWATCEVAAALHLNFQTSQGAENQPLLSAESAVFTDPGGKTKLYYNKGLRGGWYSANRPGLPRPDLRLEVGQQQIFLDVKYRVGREDRARPDDMYKMLAYMNDFAIKTGGIIFPGQQPGAKALVVENPQSQRLIELALRPPDEANQADFEAELGQVLRENLL